MEKLRKICWHHWKERPKISKIAKFESDLLKTNKDTAPQSREILQTFVWWPGAQTCPPHHHANVCKFSLPRRVISSLPYEVSLSNLAILLILRCSCPCQKFKNREKVYYYHYRYPRLKNYWLCFPGSEPIKKFRGTKSPRLVKDRLRLCLWFSKGKFLAKAI